MPGRGEHPRFFYPREGEFFRYRERRSPDRAGLARGRPMRTAPRDDPLEPNFQNGFQRLAFGASCISCPPGEGQRPQGAFFLRHAEFQQLDGVEVLHAATDTLGGIEQHIGFGAIGIAQHTQANTIDDKIAAIEIAKSDGHAV